MRILTTAMLTLAVAALVSGCLLEKRGRFNIEPRQEADLEDGVCDRPTENGWSPECMGLAMFDDGVCEDGDFDFAPECSERAPVEFCGDGRCSPEERGHCWPDCDFGICGDGICSRLHNENPWCRVDCELAVSECGDGVCELGENVVCGRDCGNGLCGDGACNGSESEWCEHDCGPICGGDTPVNCGDGCYPAGTECRGDSFVCGGEVYRCSSRLHYANCCDGVFRQLLGDRPFYCPADNSVSASFENCPSADRCEFRGVPCVD